MVQGMGLDPSMIDNYHNNNQMQPSHAPKQGGGGRDPRGHRFVGAAQEVLDSSVTGSPGGMPSTKDRRTPNRNNRRLVENQEMSNRMALAAAQ